MALWRIHAVAKNNRSAMAGRKLLPAQNKAVDGDHALSLSLDDQGIDLSLPNFRIVNIGQTGKGTDRIDQRIDIAFGKITVTA